LPVHPRHPYGGELVFTAFSGSHQDAIKKGFAAQAKSNTGLWEVPYLPIDPQDLGRSYEAVIRVNSQSGKGGIAYLLETDYGLELPRRLQIEFAQVVQRVTDTTGKELSAKDIYDAFAAEYLEGGKFGFVEHTTLPTKSGTERKIDAKVRVDGKDTTLSGEGNGPIAAYVDALSRAAGLAIDVVDYREHAIKGGDGAKAKAAAYVEAKVGGRTLFGVGVDSNIVTASLKAVTSATNRALR
jgi:2-isopropylmalate synthase